MKKAGTLRGAGLFYGWRLAVLFVATVTILVGAFLHFFGASYHIFAGPLNRVAGRQP